MGVMKKVIFISFFILLGCNTVKENKYSFVENKIEELIKNYDKIIIIPDNSCNICFTNFITDIKEKVKKSSIAVLCISNSSKVSKKRFSFLKLDRYISDNDFYLIKNELLLNEIYNLTSKQGFSKGFYYIDLHKNKIEDILIANY